MRETNMKRVTGISLESACLEGRHTPISIPSAMLPHHPGALPLVGGLAPTIHRSGYTFNELVVEGKAADICISLQT